MPAVFTKTKLWWVKAVLYLFWGLITAFALSLIALYGTDIISGTEASTNPNAVADLSGGLSFEDYMCAAVKYAGPVLGGLAIFMIVLAGVIYAGSAGGKSVIGSVDTAKDMITAAITGAVFYMLGQILLGPCGVGGGWLTNLFSGINQ